jgi:hypothetical protein
MWHYLLWALGGGVIALSIVGVAGRWQYRQKPRVANELRKFFSVRHGGDLVLAQRSFPMHVAPDVSQELKRWLADDELSANVIGIPVTNTFMTEVGIGTLLSPSADEAYATSAVEFESIDVGEEQSVDVPKHVVWLLERRGGKAALFWTSSTQGIRGQFETRLRLETARLPGAASEALADGALECCAAAAKGGRAYRGKILSLERSENFGGSSAPIAVHKLRSVSRADVILPESTIALLDRNVLRFVEQRSRLAELGMPIRKGLLFYGPPGTGKTHTIHYLVGALKDHTTLLITAEQIAALSEYMTLARLLQPCVVVIEDVDLIARNRDESGACEQSMLNRLLNEMDGLREDSAILFILTTNRPKALEEALTARPGRIDQAIEFPLPDARGREKLANLYACGANIAPDVVQAAVRATQGVSAAFIKELMRRAIQFHLECRPNVERPQILQNDIDQAIDELLLAGGALNRALLGAGDGTHPP